MRDGGGDGPRAALVVEIAACWRGQAAQVIMMVMVIEGMDGVSTNHSCEWTQIIERYGLDLAHKAMRLWKAWCIYNICSCKQRTTQIERHAMLLG